MLYLALYALLPALSSACFRMHPPTTTTTTTTPMSTTTCPTCADLTQSTAPTTVQTSAYFTFSNGCSKATNNCPTDGGLETDQGVITIPPTDAESQELTCTGGDYETTYKGTTYTVTADVCYVARCAQCPMPVVDTGISVVISYDADSLCEIATFSGCATGYQVKSAGPFQQKFTSPLPCVDYGATAGGRW
ncbi:unnamed protein product, partial [Mesorhabditis belari]|uniref:Uncharacterized protein n=1 Tax=Mesorhabditis belari TaxID=2138241 RepID=A0AAF3EQT7_9BILA